MDDDPYIYTKSILKQPNRTLPDVLVEEEYDDQYNKEYEEELLFNQSIINNKQSRELNLYEPKKKEKDTVPHIKVEKKNVVKINKVNKTETRKFNPRLPPPNLRHKINNKVQYIFNNNEFPSL